MPDLSDQIVKAARIAHHLAVATDDFLKYAQARQTALLRAKLTDFFGGIQIHHPDDAAGAWSVLATVNAAGAISFCNITAASLTEWVVSWSLAVARSALAAARLSPQLLSAYLSSANGSAVRRSARMDPDDVRTLMSKWPAIRKALQRFRGWPDLPFIQVGIDREQGLARLSLAAAAAAAAPGPREGFEDFPGKQRKLLESLDGLAPVTIPKVLKAVYGTQDPCNLDALLKLKDRTNRRLAESRRGLEITRKANTLRLGPV